MKMLKKSARGKRYNHNQEEILISIKKMIGTRKTKLYQLLIIHMGNISNSLYIYIFIRLMYFLIFL